MLIDSKGSFNLETVEEYNYEEFYNFYNKYFLKNENISKNFINDIPFYSKNFIYNILNKGYSLIITKNNKIVALYLVTDNKIKYNNNDINQSGNKIISFLNSFKSLPEDVSYIEGFGMCTKEKYQNCGLAKWMITSVIKHYLKKDQIYVVKATSLKSIHIFNQLNFLHFDSKMFNDDIKVEMFIYIKYANYNPEYLWFSVKDKIASNFSDDNISKMGYNDFMSKIPSLYPNDYKNANKENIEKLLDSKKGYLISTTSGSTSYPKIILHRMKTPFDNLVGQKDICVILDCYPFSSFLNKINNDILLTGSNTIPSGHLDKSHHTFNILKLIKANVLVGYSSIIKKFINTMNEAKVKLNIEKIIFYGEPLNTYIRKIIYNEFGDIQIIGLFGGEDVSCIGILKTNLLDDEYIYKVRNEIFLEKIDNKLFITNINDELPVPNLRYHSGDNANLFIENNIVYIKNIQRVNSSFLFFGEVFHYHCFHDLIKPNTFQIVISTNNEFEDLLQIVILQDSKTINIEKLKTEIEQDEHLRMLKHFKNWEIQIIYNNNKLFYNPRGKLKCIHDMRDL